jgi:SAM-dependent MidA family methyltransferase
MWPHRFFRTSVHVGAVFHRALATLLAEVDDRLGRPDVLDLVDVGAGRGELLPGVLDELAAEVAARVRAVAVDVHAPPPDLDARVTWVVGAAPDAVPHGIRGLVVANEWLDDVPLDVVQLDHDLAPRLVLVTRDGTETLGPRLDDDEAWAAWGLDAARARDWIDRWWPLTPEASAYPGDRAEIGVPRDDAWHEVVARLDAGTALAIDYAHHREHHRHASLTGYRLAGRVSAPVPDGSINLTAHVAVDAVAEAVGVRKAIRRQREALQALGVSAALPASSLAAHDPSAYADALQAASDAAELLDPSGLGAFVWVRLDR